MVSGPRSTSTAERWAVLVVGLAVTVTLEEPDRRRSLVRVPVVKPALSGVDVSIRAAQSVSLSAGSSVKVSVPLALVRPRVPTPGRLPTAGRKVVAEVPRGGQDFEVTHWSGWR